MKYKQTQLCVSQIKQIQTMSKSSLATNRLLHISDLPNSQKYSTADINKLLPLHFSTLRDNVLTMIYYESSNFESKNMVHDPSLTLNSTNYSQVRGGWCQDFDQNEEVNANSHIRKSIEIGVVLLNYLSAISQAKFKSNNLNADQTSMANKMIIKAEHYKSFLVKYSQGSSSLESLTSRVRNSLKNQIAFKKTFGSLNLQKLPECFSQHVNMTITYNIYKKNKKYIFLTGVNQNCMENFYNSLNLFRNWNTLRLKTELKIKMDFTKLYRSSSYLQHLFSLARGFIFSTFQQKSKSDIFLPLCDLNDNKKYLKQLLQYFDMDKDLQYSSQQIFNQIRQNQNQIVPLLDDTIKLYKFGVTYKMQNYTDQEKSELMQKLTSHLFCRIVCQVLAQVPINVNISYHFASKHSEQTNQLNLIVILNFKSNLSKHLFLSPEQINVAIKNLTQYLNKQSFQTIKKSQGNIADEVFKNSYRIFHKYSGIVQNTPNKYSEKDFEEKFSNLKLSSNFAISHSQTQIGLNRTNNIKQRMSNVKSNLFNNQSNLSGKRLQPPQTVSSTLFSKSSAYSEIEVEFKNLIKSLEQRKQKQKILNPFDLRANLKHYLEPFNTINNTSVLAMQKHEKQSLNFVAVCCQFLPSEDISKLFEKYEDNADALCDFFMQQSNYDKMVQVGKNFTQHLETLFRKYVNLGTRFKDLRYNLIVNYLKKIMQKYYTIKKKNSSFQDLHRDKSAFQIYPIQSPQRKSYLQKSSLKGSPLPSKSTRSFKQQGEYQGFSQLRMQDLIFLLENKSYNCSEYRNLLSAHLKEIFQQKPGTKYISTILYDFYIHLQNNGHQVDLISSFIAQIFFQVVYFTDQLTQITLNNSRYLKNVSDLKYKKFYQVVRDGGFLNFGFEIRNILIPQIMKTSPFVPYQDLIVSTIRIQKSSYFKTVIKMIQNSFFSQNFGTLGSEIKKKKQILSAVSKQVCMPFYRFQIISQVKSHLLSVKQIQSTQQPQEEPLSNINLSESGIFRQLLALNPNLKIAGSRLKEQYSRKLRQIQLEQKKYTPAYFLNKIAILNVQQAWEYIQLALQIRDKVQEVDNYSKHQGVSSRTSHLQEELMYIKQTFQQIYSRLSKIYEYLTISDIMCEIRQLTNEIQHNNDPI